MPIKRVEFPDGSIKRVEVPEGATNEQILAFVQSQYQPEAQPAEWQPRKRSVEELRQGKGFDPAEGQGFYQNYLAGLGKSLVDTGQGLKQAGTDAVRYFAEQNPILVGDAPLTLENILNPRPQRGLAGLIGGDTDTVAGRLRARVAAQQAEQAERQSRDAPLTATTGGMLGNIVGTVGQIAGPALPLRGTALASAALPRTVLGNVAQGGVVGAVQPVAEEGERQENIALGAGLGGAGAAVPAGLSRLYRATVGSLGRSTLSGAEQRAAELVRGESSGLAGLMQPQPSSVPGVQRTLAEETLDPGIARLERNLRGQTNVFQPIDVANNAARIQALETFAGDPAALRAAQRTRTQQAVPLLGQAYLDKGVDVGPVRALVESVAKKNATRPSVQSAILDVKASLDKAGDDVFSLYGTRKYIDDLLAGKAGADKSYARAAQRELLDIKALLDEQMAAKSPAFAQYLEAFRSGSKPIDRMKIGQELLKSGGAVLDPQTGLQVLTPAQFSKNARDLDAVAAKATGFKKARAEDVLLPDDVAVIRAIQDDLQRQAFRASAGSAGNSQTAERLMLQDKLGSRLAGKIPVIGGFVDAMNMLGNQRVNTQLARMMADPAYARSVLAKLNKAERSVVNKALIQIGGRAGATTPALTE